MQKSIINAPARLQRMILLLQRYSFQLVHVQGKQIPVAETLSTKYLPHTMPGLSKGTEAQVHLMHEHIQVSVRIGCIRNQTTSFNTLIKYILEGWPESRRDCIDTFSEY